TMLYRSTDRLCRGGAAVKNLAHSASLHACEKTAPSNPGIKHLDRAAAARRFSYKFEVAIAWPASTENEARSGVAGSSASAEFRGAAWGGRATERIYAER